MTELKYRGVDMCAPETHDVPWEMYDYLRENDPVYWDEHNEVWYAFRYDDIIEIARDPATWCSTEGNRPNLPPDPSMIHQDGDSHAKQRGLVSKGFTPRAMREIDEHCHAIVAELIGAFRDKGEFDVVDDLAALLPVRLIGEMLGVPHEKHPTLRRWVQTFTAGGMGPQYVTDEVNEAFGEFCEHHAEMVEEREGNTGDTDLLLRWMNAELDGQKLEEEQLLFEHALLLVGGAETTRNAIAGGMEMLARNPDQWAYLRANIDDEKVIAGAIEEMIRWVTPFNNMFRTATRDVELRGKTIKEGQMIAMQYPSANRDPRVFKDPYKFDVRRDPKEEKHISFGFGSHFCLGANLARLELRATLTSLLRALETVSLKEGGRNEIMSSSFVRGHMHCDLTFTLAQ
ncbi:MAG: cytochrome P450 [Polyangiales bacterium]|nr:cytochrome P450 [Myxococcales bacterium]MCB9658016.1 cytochrome P450 [Sandaracinaceae bacterium]